MEKALKITQGYFPLAHCQDEWLVFNYLQNSLPSLSFVFLHSTLVLMASDGIMFRKEFEVQKVRGYYYIIMAIMSLWLLLNDIIISSEFLTLNSFLYIIPSEAINTRVLWRKTNESDGKEFCK